MADQLAELKSELQDKEAEVKAIKQSMKTEKAKFKKFETTAHAADSCARKAEAHKAELEVICKQLLIADLHLTCLCMQHPGCLVQVSMAEACVFRKAQVLHTMHAVIEGKKI